MPTWSKIDFCRFLASWAGQDCHCLHQVGDDDTNEPDITPALFLEGGNEIDDVTEEMDQLMRFEKKNICNGVVLESKGSIIPLPWELLQPALRIVGHCLMAPLNSHDIKDAASVAVKRLYARASHDLVPQAILATQSLIQLDKRARESAKAIAAANSSSNANTPSKAKNPEVLLVSK